MNGYIKTRADFKTTCMVTVDSYTLPVGQNTTGSVTVTTELNAIEGDWFIMDGEVWYIESVTPKDGKTTIKVSEPINGLSHEFRYTTGASSIEAFIYFMLQNFLTFDDTFYRMNYMAVDAPGGSTTFVEPVTDDYGIYDISDYIFSARRSGIWVSLQLNGVDGLTVKIKTETPASHKVILGDGNAFLDTASFTKDITSKVTVCQKADDDSITETNWYLQKDGSISETEPAERISGKWRTIGCGSGDEPQEVAQDIFDDNENSHKIVFYSSRDFNLYDHITFRFENGTMYTADISAKQVQSSDARIKYTCGELPTTLTEQLAAAKKEE